MAVGAATASAVGQIITFPVFDDFGELTGALIAHRGMRLQEPQLTDFSKLSGIGLVLLNGVDPISVAGMPNEVSYRLSQLDSHQAMQDWAIKNIASRDERESVGQRAKEIAAKHRGALETTLGGGSCRT